MTVLKDLAFPEIVKKDYDKHLPQLQYALMRYQQQIFMTGKKVVIAVEGTDASGKGGLIKRLTHLMDPRGVRVYPIGAPSPSEAKQHYLQRFWSRLPIEGEIVIFDRTWYGRVLVEPIEHGLPAAKVKSAFDDIGSFEKQLQRENIVLIKLFLQVDFDEQTRRFLERLNDPLKSWKLTEADLISRTYWKSYQKAYQAMIDQDKNEAFKWHVIPANDKKFARIEAMKIIQSQFELQVGPLTKEMLDPELKARVSKELKK